MAYTASFIDTLCSLRTDALFFCILSIFLCVPVLLDNTNNILLSFMCLCFMTVCVVVFFSVTFY